MTSGYDLIRVTLQGVTHAGLLLQNSSVTTTCGVSDGFRGEVYSLGVLAMSPPDVDCMSCLVAEGKRRVR